MDGDDADAFAKMRGGRLRLTHLGDVCAASACSRGGVQSGDLAAGKSHLLELWNEEALTGELLLDASCAVNGTQAEIAFLREADHCFGLAATDGKRSGDNERSVDGDDAVRIELEIESAVIESKSERGAGGKQLEAAGFANEDVASAFEDDVGVATFDDDARAADERLLGSNCSGREHGGRGLLEREIPAGNVADDGRRHLGRCA